MTTASAAEHSRDRTWLPAALPAVLASAAESRNEVNPDDLHNGPPLWTITRQSRPWEIARAQSLPGSGGSQDPTGMTGTIATAAPGTEDCQAAIVAAMIGREDKVRTQLAIGGLAGAIGAIAIVVRGDETEVETVIDSAMETATPTGSTGPIAKTMTMIDLTAHDATDRLPSSTSENSAFHPSQKMTTSMFPLLRCYVELTAITTQYDVGAVPSVADS